MMTPVGPGPHDRDECAMVRERSVAGRSDEIPGCSVCGPDVVAPPARELLDLHRPSIRPADDAEMDERRWDLERDNADLALRTCGCGVRVDGFDEWFDHMADVLS